MAVPELMRILLDEAHLGWDEAWDITKATLAYTNHTLLPEALEKWPLAWFKIALPRQLEIVLEINRRLVDEAEPFSRRRRTHQSVSLVEDGTAKSAWRTAVWVRTVRIVWRPFLRVTADDYGQDLAELFPERFNNKAGNHTRRWLLLANPALSRGITAS
jgi:starch phosphorylase